MPMRVIAGKYRHRHLSYPENEPGIRPTKDRIREAFFSSLGDIEGKVFLDLCAGCGAMGIEAISRGAYFSYFVDNNQKSLSYIKNNMNSLDIQNGAIVFQDCLSALESFASSSNSFDIIYFDPPYEYDKYEEVIAYIFEHNLLNKGGLLAFESNKEVKTNPLWYSKKKEYHYGEITVTVLR